MRISKKVRAVLLSLEIDPDADDLQFQLQFTRTGRLRRVLGNNFKTMKGEDKDVLTAIMHLAPAWESGANTCAFATNCAILCIKGTGRLATPASFRARICRTLLLKLFPEAFMAQLRMELHQHTFLAKTKGMIPAVRLNGTSDELWEKTGVVDEFPDLAFYDYTKWPLELRSPPANYHLTYSLSEDPESMGRALSYLEAGHNAAAVFQSGDGMTRVTAKASVDRLLEAGEWMGYPIISGDEDDIRFWDPPGHWVALYAKGPATKDTTGFVQRVA